MAKRKMSPEPRSASSRHCTFFRFSYNTGTAPERGGDGVSWSDGTAVYREVLQDGTLTQPITGHVDDIVHMYGGHDGFHLWWVDE